MQAQLGVVTEAASAVEDETQCVVCMDERKQHVMMPCMHVCVCSTCAQRLLDAQTPHCPVCRTPVESTTCSFRGVPTYLAVRDDNEESLATCNTQLVTLTRSRRCSAHTLQGYAPTSGVRPITTPAQDGHTVITHSSLPLPSHQAMGRHTLPPIQYISTKNHPAHAEPLHLRTALHSQPRRRLPRARSSAPHHLHLQAARRCRLLRPSRRRGARLRRSVACFLSPHAPPLYAPPIALRASSPAHSTNAAPPPAAAPRIAQDLRRCPRLRTRHRAVHAPRSRRHRQPKACASLPLTSAKHFPPLSVRGSPPLALGGRAFMWRVLRPVRGAVR